MTDTLEAGLAVPFEDHSWRERSGSDEPDAGGPTGGSSPEDAEDGGDDRPELAELIRPLLAAFLAASAAALVAGGIFGSWGARAVGVLAVGAGVGWAVATVRSTRPTAMQLGFPVAVVALAAGSLVVRGASPSELPSLVGDAIASGRLFRPPVPYDPGWTALLVMIFAALGFAGAWLATSMRRPRLSVVFPIPIIILAALTQPPDGQFVAGLCAFVPLLAALATLFGGEEGESAGLGAEFEIKRALRSLVLTVPIIAAVFLLSQASFLFPEPVVNPNDQPQKPRAIPLSAAQDRVLFEVKTDSTITGPWRVGVLDVYDPDDGFWKSPPRQLEPFPPGGAIGHDRTSYEQLSVEIQVRDLGNTPVLPVLGGTTAITFADQPGGIRFDPRTVLVRMASGRVPATSYTLRLPPYATADQLEAAAVPSGRAFKVPLDIPEPPGRIRDLLAQAPANPWLRLDFLRQKLLGSITSSGVGAPDAITPKRVAEMLRPDAEATPFEIVAAEAMLARWSGVPSRIGTGFDGLNVEGGVLTVRPKNSAQWLEVYFNDIGWLPLIGTPKKAQNALDNDPNARFNPTIEASDDVSVLVYVPYKVQNVKQLFERIRQLLLRWLPIALVLALAYLCYPALARARRAAKRRHWAARRSPVQQIAVEYAELRDLAIDLNVGDIYSTPIQYTFEVRDDAEHREMAWLVIRTLYGDLRDAVDRDDVARAVEMSASIRRRLRRAQPLQTKLAGFLSRASLEQPFTNEVPNVRVYRLPRARLPRWRKRPGGGGRLRQLLPGRSVTANAGGAR